MSNLYLAAQQYATRPADESYRDLPSLLAACRADDARCAEFPSRLDVLRAKSATVPGPTGTPTDEVILNGKTSAARLTNWAFGQACSFAGAPAAYLRTLRADLAAECINASLDARLKATAFGKGYAADLDPNVKVYLEKPQTATDDAAGAPLDARLPLIRSLTSANYARVRDSAIVSRLVDLQNARPDWQLPLTWEGPRAGAYRGDRDSFIILTNGGSIVTDPTLRTQANTPGTGGNAAAMYRGIIVRNSEVGACSLQFHYVLFRFICGNHIIWNVSQHAEFRRRHVGIAGAEFIRQLSGALRDLTTRPESADQAIVAALAAKSIGKDTPEVIKALRELGATEAQAKAAYAAAEQHETDPRSAWGIMQGITRASQTQSNSDDRFALDLIAAKIAKLNSRVAA